ncbi:MAG: hypothetical protein AAF830_16155 [Pseudomonadota bacterium]
MPEVKDATYLHLKAGEALPLSPFDGEYICVLILEESASSDWRSEVSDWLVDTGCINVMAWGSSSSSWRDSISDGCLDDEDPTDLAEADAPLVTWYDDETLEEVFRQAKQNLMHPGADNAAVLLLDVSPVVRFKDMLDRFDAARGWG